MSSDTEQLLREILTSPWVLVLGALTIMLVGRIISGFLERRRERRRRREKREYWRKKFESELPEILSRNRRFRELPPPPVVPRLSFDDAHGNESYVLSGEVLAVNQDFDDGPTQIDNADLEDPAPDFGLQAQDSDLPASSVPRIRLVN